MGKLILNHLIGKSKPVSSKVNVKVFVENQRRKLEQEVPHNIENMYISNSDAFRNLLKKIRKNEISKKPPSKHSWAKYILQEKVAKSPVLENLNQALN